MGAEKKLADQNDEASVDFEGEKLAADTRRNLLEEILLGMETESVDVLSLMLIVTDALDDFTSKYAPVSVAGGDADADRDFNRLYDAIHAMMRWLVNHGGARGPIPRLLLSQRPPRPGRAASLSDLKQGERSE